MRADRLDLANHPRVSKQPLDGPSSMSSRALPTQTRTPLSFANLPNKQDLCNAFVGKHLSELRTPAFVVDRAIVVRNCAAMLESAQKWGAKFRAHVKTHKTSEGARMQLVSGDREAHAVVVSTLMEAWQLVDAGLVSDGTIKDLLYGLPVSPTKIADLDELSKQMKAHGAAVRLMVDNIDQVRALETYNAQFNRADPWSVFVKVDLVGHKRAGLPHASAGFRALVETLVASPSISIFGFYCHAGHSYASKNLDEASSFLSGEVESVLAAAVLARSILQSQINSDSKTTLPFVLSVGSTPTAHAFSATALEKLVSLLDGNVLELHAGNYPFCDLQQLATGLISADHVAQRVLAAVISYYPGRGEDGSDEAMCDAGGIAMSKDIGPWSGYGDVVGIVGRTGVGRSRWKACGWRLGRVSQEHGILVRKNSKEPIAEEERLRLGDVLEIVGQHACMIAAAYPWYYVVDSEDTAAEGEEVGGRVVDVWVPWKGW
ncbi:hypothetical protein BOTBODRAFT_30700 [Botryobasidium botryosum FD-172 SS1]|uniref:D-serine dehydratase n=1 Tax=Botryobasidium botryosum (strain FD-172 SS1) TaxID=930990 RepID=A0A067MY80_BOTB1|nr:hypothetical protein BOTBODRAFT_30700 [Botryobasidium botryosum FD-172 SS1]